MGSHIWSPKMGASFCRNHCNSNFSRDFFGVDCRVFVFVGPLHMFWKLKANQMKEFSTKKNLLLRGMLLCVLKYGFCHMISWYELFKLSSFERLMKGNYFMCASSDVRNFSVFSFSIKNYENNMLVQLAMVSQRLICSQEPRFAFVIAGRFMRLFVCGFQFD